MEIKKGNRCFYIGESEKKPLAIITYVPTGENLITVDHTYVSDQLAGQGVGKRLLHELTEWARKENLKIIPQCSFVKAQMEKNKEYHDLLG
ncbi:hypothetical protein DFR55_11225 [Herbinix hemicellulosilytica]|uniref:Uncharacterized protein n=1 Tax=Herbinix hemicellulosilytica TaxID=1564487 RepID=A0A0H5SH18_HERHM|nr:GNAT family N-acetyltransferase [Herbinix hemicellulosilytica]RBP58364.1 hypothetical protein DFR55_11225 [Herbinix hemicellulosilytica]CRZ34081.1 hypothetical protein HHT355_0878 [Herbinix hemicellulosilytica]